MVPSRSRPRAVDSKADASKQRRTLLAWRRGVAGAASPASLAHLRDVCDEFAELVERRDFERWLDATENRRRLSTLDHEFHATILAARAIPTAKQHREIDEAIRKRDPAKAARLMQAHVGGMKDCVLDIIHRPS